MALDEVAVIAVHRSHQRGERYEKARREAAPEPGGFLGKVEGEVVKSGAVRRPLPLPTRLDKFVTDYNKLIDAILRIEQGMRGPFCSFDSAREVTGAAAQPGTTQ